MMKKWVIIKIACFLSAFAAVVAGFLVREFIINKDALERADALDKLTLSQFAENIEKMTDLLSNESSSSFCADIMLSSSLAHSALGFSEVDCPELFAFLKSVSKVSGDCIVGEADKEIFSLFSSYSKKICDDALPDLLSDKHRFEEIIKEIFSDTSLETVLYEKGYGHLAEDVGFKTLGSGRITIDENEAIRIAKKYLGKNAYLSAALSKGEQPFFHVAGKNISAVISAGNGAVLQILFDLPEGNVEINVDEAEINARKFLSEVGVGEDTFVKLSLRDDGDLYLFEYAPMRKGVLCISEKILLGVSSGSGRISLFDAVDFYRYKTGKVTLPDGILSAQEIAERFSLTSLPELCKIERKKGVESICYRYKDGDGYRYVNAVTAQIIERK